MANEVIRTERIEIVDSEGRVRASLGMQHSPDGMIRNGPVLAMYTTDGKRLISLELLNDDVLDIGGHTPRLVMRSENGAIEIDLGADNGAGDITLRNPKNGFTIGGEVAGPMAAHGFDNIRDETMEAIRDEWESADRMAIGKT